jgi:uncharacterized protein
MWRIIRISSGSLLILLGIAGLVLPILQGWLFLALGAIILSMDIPFFQRIVNWIEGRFPRIRKPLQRMKEKLKGSKEEKN